jgi:ABC-2 type transport system permease protein
MKEERQGDRMKRLLLMIRLRVKLTLTTKTSLLSFVLLPVITVLFMYTFYDITVEEARIPVVVADHDETDYSERVIEKLGENRRIRLEVTDEHTMKQLVLTNEADSGILFEPGFKDEILMGEKNSLIHVYQSESSLGVPFVKEIVASEVMRFISNYQAAERTVELRNKYELEVDSGTWLEAWEYTDGQWEPEPLMSVAATELPLYKPGTEAREGERAAAEGLRTLLLLISAVLMLFLFSLAYWVIEDKEQNFQKRFLLSGVKPWQYFIGSSVPALLLGGLQLVFLLGLLVYLVPESGVWIGPATLMLVLYVFCSCYLGILLAAFFRSKKYALLMGIAVVGILTTFSAVGVPVFPWNYVAPQYLLIEGVNGSSLFEAAIYLGVITVALFFISFLVVRWKYGFRS